MPKKAAYWAFETTPGLEFEFFLAEKLGVMVGDLRERMSGDEFTHWAIYYGRRAQREQLARLKKG